jgi:hypothetical protein
MFLALHPNEEAHPATTSFFIEPYPEGSASFPREPPETSLSLMIFAFYSPRPSDTGHLQRKAGSSTI